MLTQFIFKESNPYVAIQHRERFRMFCKYYCEQFNNHSFVVCGERKWNGRKTYEDEKQIARSIAIDWLLESNHLDYSLLELSEWQGFFEYLGRKYGLMTEFKKNAIL